MEIEGKGRALLNIEKEYGGWQIELMNVLYLPKLEDNLMSISKIKQKGLEIVIRKGKGFR